GRTSNFVHFRAKRKATLSFSQKAKRRKRDSQKDIKACSTCSLQSARKILLDGRMLPSLAKHVNSAARGTRQWQQRRQPQCHARSAALRYHRSAISLPQPPQPRPPSVLLFSPVPICRLLTAPSPGG
ncbi:unnamed protein product, partial [Heterotrigona itama]